MNIRLHIDRLVLDGLPLEAAQGPAVQAAVEAELGRLLAERGLDPTLRDGGALVYARGGDLRLTAGAAPEHLGAQIARAMAEGIGL